MIVRLYNFGYTFSILSKNRIEELVKQSKGKKNYCHITVD